MENETGTQERASGDGSKENQMRYEMKGGYGQWFVKDTEDKNGRFVALCTNAMECKSIVRALNNAVGRAGWLVVAEISFGHSQYHYDVWKWLNDHDALFPDYTTLNSWDYWQAWGLLAMAGCHIDGDDNRENFTITFPDEANELLRRLDALA